MTGRGSAPNPGGPGKGGVRDDLLASGGSDAPHVLLAKIGVDVNDPNFWELGLQLLGQMVAEAESLAGNVA